MPITPIGSASMHPPAPESHNQKLAKQLIQAIDHFASLISDLMHHPGLADNRDYLEKVAASVLELNKPSLDAQHIEVR